MKLPCAGGKITIYRWHDNPVSLWAWNLGPAAPSRVDMRGLEHLPTGDQMKPAQAMLIEWREQKRRNAGEIAGPGRPKGLSDETKRKYIEIAQDYWNTQDEYRRSGDPPLTLGDFAESRNISIRTLRRALAYKATAKETS